MHRSSPTTRPRCRSSSMPMAASSAMRSRSPACPARWTWCSTLMPPASTPASLGSISATRHSAAMAATSPCTASPIRRRVPRAATTPASRWRTPRSRRRAVACSCVAAPPVRTPGPMMPAWCWTQWTSIPVAAPSTSTARASAAPAASLRWVRSSFQVAATSPSKARAAPMTACDSRTPASPAVAATCRSTASAALTAFTCPTTPACRVVAATSWCMVKAAPMPACICSEESTAAAAPSMCTVTAVRPRA